MQIILPNIDRRGSRYTYSRFMTGARKNYQVEPALWAGSARWIKDFEGFLAQLSPPLLFQMCERYELRSVRTQRVVDIPLLM